MKESDKTENRDFMKKIQSPLCELSAKGYYGDAAIMAIVAEGVVHVTNRLDRICELLESKTANNQQTDEKCNWCEGTGYRR